MSFDSFSFHPQIRAGIINAGYSTPTPIQNKSITPILEGRDLLGLAQTGTGKTAAFVLPILQRLLSGPRGKLRALIIAPTRELAEQTHNAIRTLGSKTGLRSMTIYGGVSAQPQIRGLQAGIEIAVACPGRLLDLMNQQKVNPSAVEILVLDEADRMFDMGFLPSIRKILSALPPHRQTLLFSATMPTEIRTLATDMLRHPVSVEIGARKPVETVSHAVFPIQREQKFETLVDLLAQANHGQVLIFTRTKHRAKKLALQLTKSGRAARSFQGNLSQNSAPGSHGRVSGRARAGDGGHRYRCTRDRRFENYPRHQFRYARYRRSLHPPGGAHRQDVQPWHGIQSGDRGRYLPMLRTIERLLGRPLERRQSNRMQ